MVMLSHYSTFTHIVTMADGKGRGITELRGKVTQCSSTHEAHIAKA